MTDRDDTPIADPVIIELGKVPKKRLRQLKKGKGPLFWELNETIDEVVKELGVEAHGKEILPVVVIYGQKRKKKRVSLIPLP